MNQKKLDSQQDENCVACDDATRLNGLVNVDDDCMEKEDRKPALPTHDSGDSKLFEIKSARLAPTNIDQGGPFFALCRSCFWTASIFGADTAVASSSHLLSCPTCLNKEIALISLRRFGLFQREKSIDDTIRVALSNRLEERQIKSQPINQDHSASEEDDRQ